MRNYGFFIDGTLYSAPASLGGIPLVRDPFTAGVPRDFNRVLWKGLMGAKPYPVHRAGTKG